MPKMSSTRIAAKLSPTFPKSPIFLQAQNQSKKATKSRKIPKTTKSFQLSLMKHFLRNQVMGQFFQKNSKIGRIESNFINKKAIKTIFAAPWEAKLRLLSARHELTQKKTDHRSRATSKLAS